MFDSKKSDAQNNSESYNSSATDYSVYKMNFFEKILWSVVGFGISAAVMYIFYEQLWVSLIVGIIFAFLFIPIRTKQIIASRKKKLLLQFKEMLEALSTSVGAGKNIQESFRGIRDDIKIQFSEDSDIIKEIDIINIGVLHGSNIEELLKDFAVRSGLPDIYNFANVFEVCYRKGGNIRHIIKNTHLILNDKIEVEMEIRTMVASKKTEQNIMIVMPVIFVVVLKAMGNLIDLKSAMGLISMTVAIVLFIIAYFVGKKILNIKL